MRGLKCPNNLCSIFFQNLNNTSNFELEIQIVFVRDFSFLNKTHTSSDEVSLVLYFSCGSSVLTKNDWLCPFVSSDRQSDTVAGSLSPPFDTTAVSLSPLVSDCGFHHPTLQPAMDPAFIARVSKNWSNLIFKLSNHL